MFCLIVQDRKCRLGGTCIFYIKMAESVKINEENIQKLLKNNVKYDILRKENK